MKTFLLLFTIGLLFSITTQAQSLFKPLPKAKQTYSSRYRATIVDTLPATGNTFQGLRFTGPMVLYALPNSTLFTGIGISYEHDTYRTINNKWYADWSIGLGGYGGGQFAPGNISGVTAVGLSASFFNKLLTIGVLYNFMTKQAQEAQGVGVSLNN